MLIPSIHIGRNAYLPTTNVTAATMQIRTRRLVLSVIFSLRHSFRSSITLLPSRIKPQKQTSVSQIVAAAGSGRQLERKALSRTPRSRPCGLAYAREIRNKMASERKKPTPAEYRGRFICVLPQLASGIANALNCTTVVILWHKTQGTRECEYAVRRIRRV